MNQYNGCRNNHFALIVIFVRIWEFYSKVELIHEDKNIGRDYKQEGTTNKKVGSDRVRFYLVRIIFWPPANILLTHICKKGFSGLRTIVE